MKETDDDESDGNRNELMTTIMRTKRTKTMMRMMGIMRMMRMLRMRMKMKMRMVIMMSRAVVGLQNLSATFYFCLGGSSRRLRIALLARFIEA